MTEEDKTKCAKLVADAKVKLLEKLFADMPHYTPEQTLAALRFLSEPGA